MVSRRPTEWDYGSHQQITLQAPLPTDDLVDLLHLCLTSTYFQYNGKHYKQLFRTAMGFPVSVVRCGWNSHAKHPETGPNNLQWNTPSLASLRSRYTITDVHKNNINEFHKHLNSILASSLPRRSRTTVRDYLTKKKVGFIKRVDKGWITTVKDLEKWRL